MGRLQVSVDALLFAQSPSPSDPVEAERIGGATMRRDIVANGQEKWT